MKFHALLLSILALVAFGNASECVLVGYYFSGQVSGGFGSQSYRGNDVGLYVDGELAWSYNDNHGMGDVAGICAGNNQPGDKCRHGVDYNGNTYYYSVDFEGLHIANCLVEWDDQGHWADETPDSCSVDNGYTFVGIGGGPRSSCGCKFQC